MSSQVVNRRRFLKQTLLATAGVGAAVAADGFLIEPQDPLAERITIRLRRLPEAFHGFRIALLGDLHFGPYAGKAQVERAVRLALAFNPDFTILTGDFVSRPLFQSAGIAGARHAEPCAQVLQQLTVAPVVSILGNHDHWNGAGFVAEALDSHGLTVLRNQSYPLERAGQRIWIVGVDDVLERAQNLDKALHGVPTAETTIVAVHEPDFADEVATRSVDLQLPGHSHGGQVRIPGLGAPILPVLGTRYPIGLNRVRELQVYTNRGIGVVTPPVRLNCPPEVTLITLVGTIAPSAV
jgi:predicted MPP superfamily phosphohydrolase